VLQTVLPTAVPEVMQLMNEMQARKKNMTRLCSSICCFEEEKINSTVAKPGKNKLLMMKAK